MCVLQVQDWISKLSTVSEVIEQWLMVQNMWMYMEAVFSGGDIVKQLPQVCTVGQGRCAALPTPKPAGLG